MELIEEFKSKKDNKIKILNYTFTGGMDLNYNPLTGEDLEGDDEYFGVFPSNKITFEVNGKKVYSKFMCLGNYIFIGDSLEFHNLDVQSTNGKMLHKNLYKVSLYEKDYKNNLPAIILKISEAMTDEDFIYSEDVGFIDDFEPRELNIEIDYHNFIENFHGYIGL